jgi:hypothetical protein
MKYTKEQLAAAKRIRKVATKAHKALLDIRLELVQAAELASEHGFHNAADNLGWAVVRVASACQGVELESDLEVQR